MFIITLIHSRGKCEVVTRYNQDMFPTFLESSADEVASRLLGCELVRHFEGGQTARVCIVETESYDQFDPASHSYKGKTPRTDVMFGPSGYLYVYFTYGMHYCCNIVTGPDGVGSAVLIRAVEPLRGLELMVNNRHVAGVNVSNGPAKLCQALQIDTRYNGHDLKKSPLRLIEKPPIDPARIVQTTRIGISQASNERKRWYIRDNPYVSKLNRQEADNASRK